MKNGISVLGALGGALCLAVIGLAPVSLQAQTCISNFDQAPENQTASFGYYYAITGGKFPTGTMPNGSRNSGGTFRRIWDDDVWSSSTRPLNTWTIDGWFEENAGLAVTLYEDDTVVYDNNGIEDGSHDGFYTWADINDPPPPGLYRGYCMSGNFDHVYATYLKLEEETTITKMIGYFDGNGVAGAELDPNSAALRFRMNFFTGAVSGTTSSGNDIWMPTCESFIGDAFSTDNTPGVFRVSDTGVVRQFPPGPPYEALTDPIWRLEFTPNQPVVLPAGVYFFSHDVDLANEVRIDLRPNSTENHVNTRARQLVRVAILSDADFDASAEVDITSVLVHGGEVSPTRSEIYDVDGDGLDDLVVFVRARAMGKPTPEECADPDAVIEVVGTTTSGVPFAGTDSVTWLGPDCK